MMRRGGETPDEEKARFKESRRFCKAVEELLGGPPDIVFEHVGQATFPTSVLAVKPFGKVVICGATSGYQLDFDVRYLWMRQKQIIGSHFANAWECHEGERADRVRARSVPCCGGRWPSTASRRRTSCMRDNKHLGKIAILVGAEAEGLGQDGGRPGRDPGGGGSLMAGVVHIPWYATVFRGDSFEEALGRSRRSRCATARPSTRSTAHATTPTSSCRSPGSRPSSDWTALLVRPGVHRRRADYSSCYQVPVLYAWHGVAASGQLGATGTASTVSPARAGPS